MPRERRSAHDGAHSRPLPRPDSPPVIPERQRTVSERNRVAARALEPLSNDPMRRPSTMRVLALSLLACATLEAAAFARHGGIFVPPTSNPGPGDTAPPGTGSPPGPTGPGPSAPTGPSAPSGPGPAVRPMSGPGGAPPPASVPTGVRAGSVPVACRSQPAARRLWTRRVGSSGGCTTGTRTSTSKRG